MYIGYPVVKLKTWYLPQHDVKHASKPGKVQSVFDCSASYSAASLNDKILSGRGLSNQLPRVLRRNHTKEVNFTGILIVVRTGKHYPKS